MVMQATKGTSVLSPHARIPITLERRAMRFRQGRDTCFASQAADRRRNQARNLGASPKTVSTCEARIMTNVGLTNIVELIRFSDRASDESDA